MRSLNDKLIPQTPWVHSPFFDRLLAERELDERTRRLARQFHEHGYFVLSKEVSGALCDAAVTQLTPHFRDDLPIEDVRCSRLADAWKFSPAVKEIAAAPRVNEILKTLFDREPIAFQTLNLRFGSQRAEHPDSSAFSSLPPDFLAAAWTALEDVVVEAGPVFVCPASHLTPDSELFPFEQTLRPPDFVEYQQYVETLMRQRNVGRKPQILKKGDVLVWSANTVHGGEPIIDRTRTRWSQITHYYFSDCIYYNRAFSNRITGEYRLNEVHNICTGKPVLPTRNGNAIGVRQAREGRYRIRLVPSDDGYFSDPRIKTGDDGRGKNLVRILARKLKVYFQTRQTAAASPQ